MSEGWVVVLSTLALVSAGLNIRAEYKDVRSQVYLFKPLTMLFILYIALARGDVRASFYQQMIVVGLLFSLAGDVFLMLPGDRFLAGLASFFVAHLFYIVAFCSSGLRGSIWLLAPVLLYAFVLLRFLWPHAGQMRGPVLVYGLVISAMAWRAFEHAAQAESARALWAVPGAVLFVLSDSALAINRFARRFRGAEAAILGTYFAAQWLITLSI